MNIKTIDFDQHKNLVSLLPKSGQFVGEQLIASSTIGVAQHINPTTGEVQDEIPLASAQDVNDAVASAKQGFALWSAMTPSDRRNKLLAFARLVESNFDDLARLSSIENGSALYFADFCRSTLLDYMHYYAGSADKIEGRVVATPPGEHLEYVVREPYGVIAAIIPWNAPLLSCAMKVPAALAAGNSVVIKPPETTPYTAIRFAELALEAGIPPGVINVIVGGPEAGEALVAHRDVAKISFTGGTPTAQRIMTMAAQNLTPVMFELGGKSANLVFDDGDLEQVIPYSGSFCMANTGQGCALPTRLLIQDSIFDSTVEQVLEVIKALPVGDPLNPETYMGPLFSKPHTDRVMTYIEDAARNSGGQLALGGKRYDGDLACGNFVQPTVILNPDLDSHVAQEEVFGPVLSVFRFKDEEEAVAIANSTKWGLASYVQTRDVHRAHKLASQLHSGVVHMNCAPNNHYASSFGGVGMSGFGREGGRAGLDEYLRDKAISTR